MSHTPEDAIHEWLARPDLNGPEGRPVPFRVLADTIRVVKKRGPPHLQLWYVTYNADGESRGTQHWQWTVLVSYDDPDQWSAYGVAGNGGVGDLPARGFPWANLGGSWGTQRFPGRRYRRGRRHGGLARASYGLPRENVRRYCRRRSCSLPLQRTCGDADAGRSPRCSGPWCGYRRVGLRRLVAFGPLSAHPGRFVGRTVCSSVRGSPKRNRPLPNPGAPNGRGRGAPVDWLLSFAGEAVR